MAFLIDTLGRISRLPRGTDFEKMKLAAGFDMAQVTTTLLGRDVVMLVDEEALLKDITGQHNQAASELYGNDLYGRVILLRRQEIDGGAD